MAVIKQLVTIINAAEAMEGTKMLGPLDDLEAFVISLDVKVSIERLASHKWRVCLTPAQQKDAHIYGTGPNVHSALWDAYQRLENTRYGKDKLL